MGKRKQNVQHLLQKLYNRQISGSFTPDMSVMHNRASQLFHTIPERLMFYLQDIFQHLANHVLMGVTRCGQFLITYSYRATEHRMLYKYRLHWWAFRPGAPAFKVAEAQLFDNHEIRDELTVIIAQWPNVNNKVIAFGYCDDEQVFLDREVDSENRCYYLTVTTVPSLHDCYDCRMVAASFDEEDMAANWDSCVGLSCLKHGLTVHSAVEVAPPYPSFDISVSIKLDNKVIINTGNFLHVLSVDLENSQQPLKEPSTTCDTIKPAEINHHVGLHVGKGGDYVMPWDFDIDHKVGTRKHIHNVPGKQNSVKETTNEEKSTVSRGVNCRIPKWGTSIPQLRAQPVNKAWLTTIMDQAEKIYAFEESEDGCEPKFKWFRRRRLADKMYEFCSDEEDMENIRPSSKLPRYHNSSSLFRSRERIYERKHLKEDKEIHKSRDAGYGSDEDSDKTKRDEIERCLLPEEECITRDNQRSLIADFETQEKFNIALESMLDSGRKSIKTCIDSSGVKKKLSDFENEHRKLLIDNCDIKDIYEFNDCDDLETNTFKGKNTYLSEHKDRLSEPFSKIFLRTKHELYVNTEIQPDHKNHNLYTGDRMKVSSSHCSCSPVVTDSEVPKSIPCSSQEVCVYHNNFVRNSESNTKVFKELTLKVDDKHVHSSVPTKMMNPDLSAIIADWEADSLSSLSPKSDTVVCRNYESKNEIIQTFLEIIPSTSSLPRSTKLGHKKYNMGRVHGNMVTQGPAQEIEDCNMGNVKTTSEEFVQKSTINGIPLPNSRYPRQHVVLKPRNRNRKEVFSRHKETTTSIEEKPKITQKEERVKIQKDNDRAPSHQPILGCSVQFDRRYIEVDEEIISTITDIEDDDQSTGFHCALPLSVHGSAYAQMQMIANHKAEKLNIPCGLVRQTSLDIEQFCFKAADIICKCEGFKFWFCNDYDMEIVDVCPLNGDILVVVCMRLNAEKYTKEEWSSNRNRLVGPRNFYECRSVFVWNPEHDQCWLEAYSPLQEVKGYPSTNWCPAKTEAAKLKEGLQHTSLFTLPPHPAIRSFTHRMWGENQTLVDSLVEIRDHSNLFGIRLSIATSGSRQLDII